MLVSVNVELSRDEKEVMKKTVLAMEEAKLNLFKPKKTEVKKDEKKLKYLTIDWSISNALGNLAYILKLKDTCEFNLKIELDEEVVATLADEFLDDFVDLLNIASVLKDMFERKLESHKKRVVQIKEGTVKSTTEEVFSDGTVVTETKG